MHFDNFTVKTNENREIIDITENISDFIVKNGVASGLCHIFLEHTTCAVSTADLDPGTDLDMLDAFWEMIPRLNFRHPHNPKHVPAHILSSIIGTSLTVPFRNSKLVLGVWQRIVLIELDGPKDRNVYLSFIKD